MIEVVVGIGAGLIGIGAGYLVAKKINDANYSIFLEQAKAKAKAIEFEAESILKDAKVKVNEAEFEAKKRYEEKGSRLQKEYNQKLDDISKKEHAILNEQEILKNSKDELEKSQNQAKTLYEEGLNLKIAYQDKLSETLKVLEHVAGLTEDEAKNMVLRKVEEKSRAEIAHIVRKYEEEAKKEAKKRANYILAQATSRYAGEFAAERLINVVNIKNDELKGRIIGKEGRNIKTLEMVLGVDVIIDDTPHAIILSSFNRS
ncbi:Rnase Y domain-containing protein, partial [Campylobacter fetus]|uniref:Rnase Y domain-containing protein n=1 Tax=Campylobacter fetus TaxID=196 RepID=UPI00143D5EA6